MEESLVTFHVSDLKFSVTRPAYLGLKWGASMSPLHFLLKMKVKSEF